jgi:TPR repeat protein
MRRALLVVLVAVCLAAAGRADEVGPRGEYALSPEEMAAAYRLRAEAGDAAAQSRLGILYRNGRGLPQSDREAFRWIREAAEAGHGPAQHYLGLFYLSGVGTQVDLERAARWLRRAADRDEAETLLALAWFALDENGVPGFAAETTALVRNSAELGLARADRAIERMQGERTPPPAEESGIDWLRQTAESGNAQAQYQLGLALDTGLAMPADPGEAVGWFERAAAGGEARAMRRLGLSHLLGRGVRQDRTAAYRWFWLAQRRGDPMAEQDALYLAALLGRDLRERAQAEAVAWEEQQALAR